MAKLRVIVITSDECVPCEELKKKLTDMGVKFTVYNVDTKSGLEFILMMKERELKLKTTTPQVILKELGGDYTLIEEKALFEMIESGEILRKK